MKTDKQVKKDMERLLRKSVQDDEFYTRCFNYFIKNDLTDKQVEIIEKYKEYVYKLSLLRYWG